MKNLILSDKATFKDAVKALDENGNGFLAIVDCDNKLKGILTDGDIRRAILDNKTKLNDVFNKTPVTMLEGSCRLSVINMLKKTHKKHMPIVDNAGVLVDVVELNEEQFDLRPNWVVIMAGGLGTRLGELTKNTPKPMLEVDGKPMLQHIIEMFVSQGFTKFMLSVNYRAEVIKNYFNDGAEFGVEIKYLEETKRLGTGGALSLIDIKIEEPFFVTNGDVLTSVDYEHMLHFHESNHSNATMGVRKKHYKIPYGVVEKDSSNNILSLQEKPEHTYFINTATYVLQPSCLNFVPNEEFFDLPELFNILNKEKLITKSYEINDFWVDMGQPKDYELIKNKFED